MQLWWLLACSQTRMPTQTPKAPRRSESGAGDTAIAIFTLALVCDATALEAAQIANHASAVVVGKLGTATVTRDELISNFEHDFD